MTVKSRDQALSVRRLPTIREILKFKEQEFALSFFLKKTILPLKVVLSH